MAQKPKKKMESELAEKDIKLLLASVLESYEALSFKIDTLETTIMEMTQRIEVALKETNRICASLQTEKIEEKTQRRKLVEAAFEPNTL